MNDVQMEGDNVPVTDQAEHSKVDAFVTLIRGLVRLFVMIAFTIVIARLALVDKIDSKDILLIFGPMIGFYFGEKAALKKAS